MNPKIKEALSLASEIRARIEIIECCEDWTGGMPDIGTCRKFGEIKRISDEARAALALCDEQPTVPSAMIYEVYASCARPYSDDYPIDRIIARYGYKVVE